MYNKKLYFTEVRCFSCGCFFNNGYGYSNYYGNFIVKCPHCGSVNYIIINHDFNNKSIIKKDNNDYF